MTHLRKASAVFGASLLFATAASAQSETHYRSVQIAQLFGESDEEKAARQQHEDNQDSSISQLNQRVHDLEDSVRRLTGQNEDLQHRIDQVNQHMIQMQKDFDYKICAMAAQQLGATPDTGDQNSLPCGGQSQSAPQSSAPQNSITGGVTSSSPDGGAIHLSPPPGVLGTLPAGAAASLPPPQAPAASPPETRKKFDAAMNLLSKAQYDEASAGFRSFADTYPQDDLASQAVYWVGAIAYVQKDYSDAARAFAEAIKKYPTSPRGPDSMLKLGLSLIAMDQKKEGCTTLGALPGKYPTASKAVTDQASAARKNAACH